jgi:hypothetical protein
MFRDVFREFGKASRMPKMSAAYKKSVEVLFLWKSRD